jgi:hypothetical protein
MGLRFDSIDQIEGVIGTKKYKEMLLLNPIAAAELAGKEAAKLSQSTSQGTVQAQVAQHVRRRGQGRFIGRGQVAHDRSAVSTMYLIMMGALVGFASGLFLGATLFR